jgi:signal transduction histidine kinase
LRTRFRDWPLGRKLRVASAVTSLAGLIPAAAAFIAYDAVTFRRLMAERMDSTVRIVAYNCVAPVVFEDAEAAEATLASLRGAPRIVSAGVYRTDAALFAGYARPGARVPAQPALSAPGHLFGADSLVVAHDVSFEGKRVGLVVIQSDLGEARARAWRYGAVVLAVLVGALLVGTMVSGRVQAAIARPIRELAETAARVSRESDYSVRARAEGRDEVGGLVLSFNQMLGHIQEQDAQLREAQSSLERRVADRTRELEAQSHQLRAANKELEAFSYSVSHDLRAPLRAIDGFSKLLVSKYPGQVLDAQGTHYLERIRAGTLRMAELIDDLLHLARITRADLVRRDVDLSRLARGVLAELERRDPERKPQLQVAEGLEVHADPHLVKVVLENLLGNAWKFTGKTAAARIEVGALANGARRVLFVRDNGAGFDMTYAEKLFGVFQRLHTDAQFEGTGIGLATVQRILLRHGGRIWAEAEVGRGATFYFSFEGDHERQADPAR